MALESPGEAELVKTPTESVRKRSGSHDGSGSAHGSRATDGTAADGSHRITIGSDAIHHLELLEAVPEEKQIFMEYQALNAWVPSMAPVGSSLIPGLPQLALPSLPFGRKASGNQERGAQLRQARIHLLGLWTAPVHEV